MRLLPVLRDGGGPGQAGGPGPADVGPRQPFVPTLEDDVGALAHCLL
jgi:hypothetical protein